MRRSLFKKLADTSFLGRILFLILLTIVLSAILITVVFTYTGRQIFAAMRASEMLPKADFLSTITSEYLQGTIDFWDYRRLIGTDSSAWGASVFIYDEDWQLIANTMSENYREVDARLRDYLPRTQKGETVSTGSNVAYMGVIVGVPIRSYTGRVIGAVFLTKPVKEVNAAQNSLTIALIVNFIIVTAIMLIPAYLGSRGIVKPLQQMGSVALAMATGDFSVRASEEGCREISQLGRSLNHLSGALARTINDLKLEHSRLRSVLDSIGEGIVAVDYKGSITHYNPASVALLGGEPSDAPEQLQIYRSIKAQVQEMLTDGNPRTVQHSVNGRILSITMTPLKNDDSRIAGGVTLIQDITEAARLEQTRRDYVANVSHELKTPIASIRTLAEALNDDLVKKEDDKIRYYGYILRESMRLSRLIDDLLELSRLQSYSTALEKNRVNTRELLYDMANRFENISRESGLGFILDVGEDCPDTFTNADRLEQVLVALLDNAVKYSEDDGIIRLEAKIINGKLHISVSNPGHLSETDCEHLFDRFYKADKAHSGGGTGLGLSIAKEILTRLDESIWVTSKCGEVKFTFTLELYEQSQNRNKNEKNL